MGLFDGMKGIKEVKKIRSGGTGKLSYAMLSTILVNIPDAARKLPKTQYEAVRALYEEFQECKTIYEVDQHGYIELCLDIITRFDEIAPFEKYSGGSELEYGIMMEEVRKERKEQIADFNDSIARDKGFLKQNRDYNYINHLREVSPAGDLMRLEDLEEFYDVLTIFQLTDKKTGLAAFDSLMDRFFSKRDLLRMTFYGFYLAVLQKNGFISADEQKELMEKYAERSRHVVLNPGNQMDDEEDSKKGSITHSDPNGSIVFHLAFDETGKLREIVNVRLNFLNRAMLEGLLSTDNIGLEEIVSPKGRNYILLFDKNYEYPYPSIMFWKYIKNGKDIVFTDMEQDDMAEVMLIIAKKNADIFPESVEAKSQSNSDVTNATFRRDIIEIPEEELRALKELRDAGILTEEEFTEKKKKLLGI